jgi:pimeloyl-ACP methyl ester carboxylesterase
MRRTPVVFIHGLWIHSSAWAPWIDHFRQAGYEPIAPGWPGDSATVAETRAHPERLAGQGIDDIADHYADIIGGLDSVPVLVGHSFGGLIAQKLLGLNLARSAVAIDPGQIKGVKPLPFAQLRSGFPILGRPGNRKRAVSLTAAQFRYGFGNAIPEAESNELFARFAIPGPGRPLFQSAVANFMSASPARVEVGNNDRGPLLFVSGGRDHTVPDVVTRAAYKLYAKSSATTELKQFPDRGHSLIFDHGWREVADFVRSWLEAKIPAN